jgi:hypothetical protein
MTTDTEAGFGGGKYDEELNAARAMTGGNVLLIVMEGKKGSGFAVAVDDRVLPHIPAILRGVANQIEGLTASSSKN